jgi:hypothetical protein
MPASQMGHMAQVAAAARGNAAARLVALLCVVMGCSRTDRPAADAARTFAGAEPVELVDAPTATRTHVISMLSAELRFASTPRVACSDRGDFLVSDAGASRIAVANARSGVVTEIGSGRSGPVGLPSQFVVQLVADTGWVVPTSPTERTAARRFVLGSSGLSPVQLPEGAATIGLLPIGSFLVRAAPAARILSERELVQPILQDSAELRVVPFEAGSERPDAGLSLGFVITDILASHEWPRGPVPRAMTSHLASQRDLTSHAGGVIWVLRARDGMLVASALDGRAGARLPVMDRGAAIDKAELERAQTHDLRRARTRVDSLRAAARWEPGSARVRVAFDSMIAVDESLVLLRRAVLPDAAAIRYLAIGTDGSRWTFRTPSTASLHCVTRDSVLVLSESDAGFSARWAALDPPLRHLARPSR